VGIFLQGAIVDSVTTTAGQIISKVYAATVSGGQLVVGLAKLAGAADPFVVIEGLRATALGSLQVAADGPVGGADLPRLSSRQLAPIVAAAVARYAAAGLPAAGLAALSRINWVITDLPGAELGRTTGDTVELPPAAAGHGWFVDPTPNTDEEFVPAAPGSNMPARAAQAADRLDLLTVVEHEMGHILGLPDVLSTSGDLMDTALPTGIRRRVDAADIDAVLQNWT
jgi:hypothetical protein